MTAQHANGVADVTTFPGRTVKLEMKAAQVAYLRYLLFRDLQEEAETLAKEAHSAYEFGGPGAGWDVESAFRSVMGVTTGILDLIGWGTGQDGDALKWLEREARERLIPPELREWNAEVEEDERREGEDR